MTATNYPMNACEMRDGLFGDVLVLSQRNLVVSRREAGILWIRRPRPQRFLVSNLQSTFLSRFLSYLAGGLVC